MNNLIDENPRIKPIKELIGENFFIPRYQRGYRWGEQEIIELLNDIFQYYKSIRDKEDDDKISKFYCLQPIVVKEKIWYNENSEKIEGWELIDGQQRLTTLYIILSYLETTREFYDNKTSIYLLDFETRENCKDFFRQKKFIEKNETNVDFFHISKAYGYIKEWFKDKLTFRLDILKTILQEKHNVSIIWYETIDENIDNNNSSSIELFTRINEGKIPLTDAELIKALLLQADRYPEEKQHFIKQRLFEIASEWDYIESSLQNDKFWYFLNATNYKPSSRIEFIFKIIAENWNNKLNDKQIEKGSKHFEYLVFDKYLTKKRKEFVEKTENDNLLKPINDIWKEIKAIFNIFHEWYDDHSLYHYIGYLLAIDNTKKDKIIKELLSQKVTKTDFLTQLKKRIAKKVKINKKKDNSSEFKILSELSYNTDNNEIINILLLFNIETLIKHKKENAKFPFHLYKTEKITSIEHIHPQNPENIETDEERSYIWLNEHNSSLRLLILNNDDNKEKCNEFIKNTESILNKFDKDKFKIIYSEIIDFYTQLSQIKENEVHTLYNLALVDKNTNSALNNSFFEIKREILKLNKLNRYIPICTQRAFSKYYSSNPQEMIFWSNNDRKEYFKAIETTYNSFINLINNNES